MLKQQAKVVARLVYLVDLSLTAAAFYLAFVIRDNVLPVLMPAVFPSGLFPLSDYLKILPVVLIIWTLLFFSHHAYHSHRTVPITSEIGSTLRIVVMGIVLLATIAWLVPLQQLSRSWFVLFGVLSAIFLVSEKIFLRLVARYFRLRGLNYRTVVVVGTGRQAREIVSVIEAHRQWGYKILGFITDGHRLPGEWGRYRVLGGIGELKKILESASDGQSEPIDEVVFALTRRKLEACESVFELCEELGIRTRVAMNFFPNTVARVELEELEGIPFVTYTTTPSNEMHLFGKRILDLSLAAILLILSLPIMVAAAVAIRLTSSGSVMFTQQRVGLNGRIFKLYKFRTMWEDAHLRRQEVFHLNQMRGGPVFKAKADPRITPVGRFLRKFSLDELPQLWNVLRGDMSLVGPRPPIPEEVNMYERWQRRRLSMKPGLTCLWQVSGRNDVDFDRWIELDLQYIDNWSPSLDLKILLRTIPAVLSGRGAS
jgi:exopolysaccharide biosynthesis polyprenyl glycosylphosphotransferase